MDDIITIHGPIVPGVSGLIYEITLPSGMVVTSPEGFGLPNIGTPRPLGNIFVTEDGRVVVAPPVVEEEPSQEGGGFDRFDALTTGVLAAPKTELGQQTL